MNQPVQPVLTTSSVIDNWEKEETDHVISRLNHLIMKINTQSTEHVMVISHYEMNVTVCVMSYVI